MVVLHNMCECCINQGICNCAKEIKKFSEEAKKPLIADIKMVSCERYVNDGTPLEDEEDE